MGFFRRDPRGAISEMQAKGYAMKALKVFLISLMVGIFSGVVCQDLSAHHKISPHYTKEYKERKAYYQNNRKKIDAELQKFMDDTFGLNSARQSTLFGFLVKEYLEPSSPFPQALIAEALYRQFLLGNSKDKSKTSESIFLYLDRAEKNEKRYLSPIHLARATVYQYLEKFERSKFHYEKAIEFARRNGNRVFSGLSYHGLAVLYRSSDQYQLMLKTAREGIDYVGKNKINRLPSGLFSFLSDHHGTILKDLNYSAANASFILSNLAFETGHYEKALAHFNDFDRYYHSFEGNPKIYRFQMRCFNSPLIFSLDSRYHCFRDLELDSENIARFKNALKLAVAGNPTQPKATQRWLILFIKGVDYEDTRQRILRYRGRLDLAVKEGEKGEIVRFRHSITEISRQKAIRSSQWAARFMRLISGGEIDISFDHVDIDAVIRKVVQIKSESHGNRTLINPILDDIPEVISVISERVNDYDGFAIFWRGAFTLANATFGPPVMSLGKGQTTPSRGKLVIIPRRNSWEVWAHELFHVFETQAKISPAHGFRKKNRAQFPGWKMTPGVKGKRGEEHDYYRWHFKTTFPKMGWEKLNIRANHSN